MAGYTKLFNSILASTIWRAADKTRIVWITLLAMADKDGVAEGSIPGLADLARVSVEDCEIALLELSSPDKYSRSGEHEGRRIEAIDGVGWQLLNHGKYRAKLSEDERREYNRQRQAEWRQRNKASQNVIDGQSQSPLSAQAEAATEAKAGKDKSAPRKRGSRLPKPFELSEDWKSEALRVAPNIQHQREFERFCDHWWAQSGAKGVKDDWLATWRNWLRKSEDFAPQKAFQSRPSNEPPKHRCARCNAGTGGFEYKGNRYCVDCYGQLMADDRGAQMVAGLAAAKKA